MAGLGLDAGVGDLVMSRPFVRRSGDWLRKAAGPVHGCGPVCFAAGTGIVTRRGQIAVEALRPGDQVLQVDGGFAPIRWIGSASHSGGEMECNEWLRPIRIRCGAVGNGLPQRDLLVSRDHRCLVRSDAALSLVGQREVLVAAGDLRGIPGVATDPAPEGVEYWHFLLDRHALVSADGALVETLLLDTALARHLPAAALHQIAAVADVLHLQPQSPVRPILSAAETRLLLRTWVAQEARPFGPAAYRRVSGTVAAASGSARPRHAATAGGTSNGGGAA